MGKTFQQNHKKNNTDSVDFHYPFTIIHGMNKVNGYHLLMISISYLLSL